MRSYSLETILVVLALVWVVGSFITPFGGNMIHLLLLVMIALLALRVFRRVDI